MTMYAEPGEVRPEYDVVDTVQGDRYDIRDTAALIVALKDCIKVYQNDGSEVFIPRHNVRRTIKIKEADSDAP